MTTSYVLCFGSLKVVIVNFARPTQITYLANINWLNTSFTNYILRKKLYKDSDSLLTETSISIHLTYNYPKQDFNLGR